MATIITKNSSTVSSVPLNTQLVAGELAINTADEKLYFKNLAGVVKVLASTAPTGDVTLTGTQTLTNKTIAFSNNTLTDVAGTTATQTLTNKTIAYADNTLTGVAGVTATQTLTNKTITNIVLDGSVTEDVYVLAGTVIDAANGTIQTKTLSANTTFTESLVAGQSVTLMIDDGTAYTVTWPTMTWKTDLGAAPTLNTTGYTVVVLWKVNSTLYGARVGNA